MPKILGLIARNENFNPSPILLGLILGKAFSEKEQLTWKYFLQEKSGGLRINNVLGLIDIVEVPKYIVLSSCEKKETKISKGGWVTVSTGTDRSRESINTFLEDQRWKDIKADSDKCFEKMFQSFHLPDTSIVSSEIQNPEVLMFAKFEGKTLWVSVWENCIMFTEDLASHSKLIKKVEKYSGEFLNHHIIDGAKGFSFNVRTEELKILETCQVQSRRLSNFN